MVGTCRRSEAAGCPATRHGSAGAVQRAPARATLHSSLLDLNRLAGNRALAGMLQRKVGWTDAVDKGYAWNKDERKRGNVRRIPLEGLAAGMGTARKDKRAWRWVVDNPETGEGHEELESTKIGELSPESAEGKAIVLVPAALDATQPIEVVVFLHGFTEGTHRPFAGLRALDPAPKKPSPKMADLRKGIDDDGRRAGPRRRARRRRRAARGERPVAARDRDPAGRPALPVQQGGQGGLLRRAVRRRGRRPSCRPSSAGTTRAASPRRPRRRSSGRR